MPETGIRIDDLPPSGMPATTAYVFPAMLDGVTVHLTVGQVIDLVLDGAPGALDTLNELAAALGDDANFAATVTAALAEKASNAALTAGLAEKIGVVAQAFSTAQKRQARVNVDAVGNIFKRTVITNSGTFNFDADTKFFTVECVGGGGGGANANAGGGLTVSAGGGGQAATRSSKFAARPASGSATITIGAGGASLTVGGTTTYSDGTNTVVAPGGRPGIASGNTATNVVGIGGTYGGSLPPSGGDVMHLGDPGKNGVGISDAARCSAAGGNGGSSLYGGGGRGATIQSATNSVAAAGQDGLGYGTGGGGGVSYGSAGAANGGAGGPGIVIITEYR